jgi:hypothetical protein
VHTVRVSNSPSPVHMARALGNEPLWLDLGCLCDIVENCFGQYNLSCVNGVENSSNCIGHSIRVTIVYPFVCSEITRSIINMVSRL